MGKYFRREKYQMNMLSKEFFKKWMDENPQFKGKIDYSKFKRYWKYFRQEFYKEVLENPLGVDLPQMIGNISVKILDMEFKCEKDFLSTTRNYNGTNERIQPISTDTPKKGKITWKKHRKARADLSHLGMEACKLFKTTIGQGIRHRTHHYQKMAKIDKVPTKCEEIKKISLFDSA